MNTKSKNLQELEAKGLKNVESRSFKGILSGFSSKAERAFEQKHLKAYLKGAKFFNYGFYINPITGAKERAVHLVK